MTWPAIVNGLQMANALAWLGVMFQFSAALRRIMGRIAQPRDAAGAWAFLIAATQIGFVLRWIFLGKGDIVEMSTLSLQVWAVLHFADAACAVGLLYTLQNNINQQLSYDLPATNARARKGILLWCVVVVLCIALAAGV